MKTSNQKSVNISLLPAEYWIYSNPSILMMNFKGGKRAEAGQWTLEIQKMLKGIVESVAGLEDIINQTTRVQKLFLEGQKVKISDEKKCWLMIYLVDNAILRIYACLDKVAQMCRCYFEYKDNGEELEIIRKCGCKEIMDENNCNFGSLITYLNSRNNRANRRREIVDALNTLNNNKSVCALRTHRNTFTHKKHGFDQTVGIDPDVRSTYNPDGTVKTSFTFGRRIPTVNWYRVEIVKANNAIVDCLAIIHPIIFPRDFKLKLTQKP